ncbi:hypothetical protein SNE40_020029 [Patella caerulea]|uniref:Integrase core domain-containing protein n=1 Tax=Patella caerulea TaxID=87958 RepID=A0AAN8IZ75_PATCE
MILLTIIAHDAVEQRKRRRLTRRVYTNLGPNFLWHVDGYDKLKPYGTCINGAIDDFSRYVLWLEAHITNSDPKLVAGYFMECIKRNNGCPSRVRTDKGTENNHTQQMQLFLRRNGQDQYANSCFLTGRSTHNQRIEQWWGFLRKQNIQYWMDLIVNLKKLGCFNGDFLDKALIQFCFMKIIQASHVF